MYCLLRDHHAEKQGRGDPIQMKRQGRGMVIVGGEGRYVLFRGVSRVVHSAPRPDQDSGCFLIKRTLALPDCLMRTLIARFATK
jgi:hypothetical protein